MVNSTQQVNANVNKGVKSYLKFNPYFPNVTFLYPLMLKQQWRNIAASDGLKSNKTETLA